MCGKKNEKLEISVSLCLYPYLKIIYLPKGGLKAFEQICSFLVLYKTGIRLKIVFLGVGGPRVNGKIREVTREELAKHKTRKVGDLSHAFTIFDSLSYINWRECVQGTEHVFSSDSLLEDLRWNPFNRYLSNKDEDVVFYLKTCCFLTTFFAR